MFKNAADRVPVAIIAGFSLLDFAAYLYFENVWVLVGYYLLMIVPKGCICAWNHHHQHVHTFRSTPLNRLYELLLAFHTGISTNLWLLHHNLGHHLNFLDQTKDESGWRTKSGRDMGALEYSLTIAATAHYRSFKVGKKHPKHMRPYLVWGVVTFAALATLIYFRPLQGILLYLLPMVTSLVFTTWVTYDHHSGLDTDNQMEASRNIMNPVYNVLTGNLGYHTAHHHRQAVHWSKLPELHATIADQIPEELYQKSTFDVFLPGNSGEPKQPTGGARPDAGPDAGPEPAAG